MQELLPNTNISHYRLIKKLGAGGMGEVFLAEDEKLGRKVALKFLPAHFTYDRQRLLRFQQEARAASALNHPNILTIYEIGESRDGTNFIATEFIEGETLRERLENEKQIALMDALGIAAQIASALKAAHASGIIHRDIKPENIMLRRDGIAKVLDFGLAKLTQQKAESIDSEAATHQFVQTRPGQVMGTVFYMSPEQTRGARVDARTDIWSLGCVLYEMLAGRSPFAAETTSDTIAKILTSEPERIENAPPELEKIIEKSLQKKVGERYQSASEILADLQDLKQEITIASSLKGSTVGEKASKTASTAEYLFGEIKRRGVRLALLSAVVLAAIAALWFSFSSSKTDKTPISSIAVLPFENASGDAAKEFLSDGITESLINSLSQLPDIKVIARSSAFRYKGKQVEPKMIANELNVQAVMTGRILQQGDTLSISVNLDDARDNSHLWGQQFIRKSSDIFAVQNEIAKQVADALRVRLTGAQQTKLTKRYTDNEEAYKLYLQGRYQWNKRTGESLKKAAGYFQQAIDKDPNFALAYAGLADCYNLFGGYGVAPPKEAQPKARAAAQKALEIDSNLAEALTTLASVKHSYDWDFAGAERDFQRAMTLNPNYATAHQWYADLLMHTGRTDEAFAEMRRAAELDPLSLIIQNQLGVYLIFARRHDEAIVQLQKSAEMDANFPNTYNDLGWCYLRKGMHNEAIASFQKAASLSDSYTFPLAGLGAAFAKTGKRGEAQKILNELKERHKREFVEPQHVSIIHAALGEKDEAFAWLEKSFEARSDALLFLKVGADFDDVRDDPRYAALVRRVGLPQ